MANAGKRECPPGGGIGAHESIATEERRGGVGRDGGRSPFRVSGRQGRAAGQDGGARAHDEGGRRARAEEGRDRSRSAGHVQPAAGDHGVPGEPAHGRQDRSRAPALLREPHLEEPGHLLQHLPRPRGLRRRRQGHLPGHKGQLGARNSPTVYNAAGHFVQFWDGRAATVEEQAKGPLTNPVEMAMLSDKHVLEVLKSIPQYVDAFKKAFPDDKDPITYDNVGKAIGAFERKLVTPSRWDKFLKGDKSALTSDEKAGFNAFLDAGCAACHTGPYLGGAVYQKAGLLKPWPNQKDQGRFDVTKNEIDKMMFKVPTLRNVAKTAPYFHDGQTKTLEEAVKMMASYQSGKELKDSEVKSIVAFLDTLTGDVPKDYIKQPELPKSTAKTPKADPK
ncbi:Cytochrome c551 peroxidase [Minicystis rosea]|nr:Cytochrome c551 peroxidase [Minicystis rosea]